MNDTLQKIVDKATEYPWTSAYIAFWLARRAVRKYKSIVWNGTVLELDLTEFDEVVEGDTPGALPEMLTKETLYFQQILFTLYAAADDSAVAGLFVRLPGNAALPLGLARTEELLGALRYFRSKGKLAVAFAPVMASSLAYLLATGFDKIFVPAMSLLNVTSPLLQAPFLRSLFDKLGIKPDVQQREEYKSMANMLRDKELDEPLKQQYNDLLNELTGALAELYAEHRNVSVERAREWLNGGPYIADEALKQGIIDGIAELDVLFSTILPKLFGTKTTEDDVVDEAAEKAFQKRLLSFRIYEKRRRSASQCGSCHVLPGTLLLSADDDLGLLSRVAARVRGMIKPGPTVALVTLEGSIFDGRAKSSPFGVPKDIHGDTAADQLRAARLDKSVKAIVLRVNSGGGSALASEQINREIQLAKSGGKKVVVSHSNVAGSGGYWISASADQIFASRLSIVGSIGVVFGKFVTRELLADRLGINMESVFDPESSSATFMSSQHPYSAEQLKKMDEFLDKIYSDFLDLVCSGRGFSLDELRPLAKGRVYFGDKGRQIRLVDERGGLLEALGGAAKLIGMKRHQSLVVQRFPKSKSTIQQLLASPPKNSRDRVALPAAMHAASLFAALVAAPTAFLHTAVRSEQLVNAAHATADAVAGPNSVARITQQARQVKSVSGAVSVTSTPTLF